MESLLHIDLKAFIQQVGPIGVAAIIFAESGLFVGFFLPGDSLLFTAGFLASQGYMNVWTLIGLSFIGAVIGVNFGYAFGKSVGPKLFKREDSLLFHKDNINKAQAFYDKYGPLTMILARFTPFVRTFAPIVAGIGKMNYKTFMLYNVIGGILWTAGITLLGYFLGKIIPNVDRYLLPIIGVIIIASVAPSIYHLWKEKKKAA